MEWEMIGQAAQALSSRLLDRGFAAATAESCTGGLIASQLTELPGSSEWFVGGVVAYANSVKQSLLGVPEETLAAHGAVSRETVLAMASGAALRLGAQCAVAVSGIAGPTGGTPEKPLGTVWIAWFVDGALSAERFQFPGDRQGVRRATALAAIEGLIARLP